MLRDRKRLDLQEEAEYVHGEVSNGSAPLRVTGNALANAGRFAKAIAKFDKAQPVVAQISRFVRF